MRIAKIVVHRVNIPIDNPYRWSLGSLYGISKGIVEVFTDEGIVGLGELSAVELADIVERHHAPRLVGADPLNLEDCFRRAVPETSVLSNTHDTSALKAFGGIEIALWDIKGKALGVPIHELLGGTVRTDVPFTEYFAFRHPSAHGAGEATPVEVAQYCSRMREEHGSTVFEGKVGASRLATDIEMVKEIRAAVGDDAIIRLDANHGWPLNTARKALRELSQYEIANIEDPYSDYWGLAQLRMHSDIPFSSHVPDIRLASHLRVPDTIVLNLSGLGGIRETLKFISACELMDIGFWFYSADAGIGTAAYIQVVAAMPYLDEPSQSLCRWYLTDVIEGGPFTPENGVVSIPSGPGLGVSLDKDALRECAERFERDGPIPFMYEDSDHYWRFSRQAPPRPRWNTAEWVGAANVVEAS